MQAALTLHGVLIADVVSSRSRANLRASLREKLRIASTAELGAQLIKIPYAVTAGDEFQVIAAQLTRIPGLILDLRRRLLPFQLRIGVGIGKISGRIRQPVNRIAGEAFENARAAINDIKLPRKYPTLTLFRTSNESFDSVTNLIYGLHDTLLQQTTSRQWDTIAAYMLRARVDRTAKALGINESVVSRLIKRGHYWQADDTVRTMEMFIQNTWLPPKGQ